MAKLSKQERLLKRYSKDGFTGAERKLIAQKLGLKLGEVRRLTRSYMEKLSINKAPKAPATNKNFVSTPSGFTQGSTKPFKQAQKNQVIGPPMSLEYMAKLRGETTTPTKPTPPPAPPTAPTPPDLTSIIEGILGSQPTPPNLTIDPSIGSLEPEVQTATNTLEELQNTYNQQNEGFVKEIEQLRGDIGGYEEQIGKYRDQVSDMSSQLLEQAKNARQFRNMDTSYLTNKTASGIRLRRSKKFRSGDFALGTSGLNRRNRSPLQISNVNL